MTIEIKHTVDATDLAQQIATGIQQGLDGFGKSLEDFISKTPQFEEKKTLFGKITDTFFGNKNGNAQVAGGSGGGGKIINASTDPLITAIKNLDNGKSGNSKAISVDEPVFDAGSGGAVNNTENLDNGKSGNSKAINASTDPLITAIKNLDNGKSGNSKAISASTEPLITAINNLTTALKTANKPTSGNGPSSGFASLSDAGRQAVLKDLEDDRAKQAKERAKERADIREERGVQRSKNIMYGALTGAAMAMVYQAGSWGATSGQSAQSVNAGTMNYNQFMSGYLNQKVSNSQSLASSAGIMGGAGAGLLIGGLFGLGLPGLAAGAVIGGVSSYYANKTGEETKALNTLALNQDLASQQIQAMGLGKRGASSLTAKGDIFGLSQSLNIPLTTLQSMMLNNKEYQGALPYVSEVALNARRDVMGSMTTAEQAKFISNSVRMGTLTGYSAGDVGSTVSHLSAVTGQDANKTLNELYKYQVQYGGDMKSNVSKIINIMQTTAMSKNTAAQLVGEYQYNEPMLQQKIAQTKVTPTSMFTALAYKDIITEQTGITSIEGMKADYRQRLARAQNAKSSNDIDQQDIIITPLEQKMFAAMNIDPFVNGAGKVSPIGEGSGLDSVARSDVEKAMGDMISDALKNISTDTVTVHGTIVNLTGPYGGWQAGTPLEPPQNNNNQSSKNKSFEELYATGKQYAKYTDFEEQSDDNVPPIEPIPLDSRIKKHINRSNQGKLGKIKR